MSTTIKRPLDPAAVRQADEDLYAKHANDKRPNALYDANGNRLKLRPGDPNQEALRDEWRSAYIVALAKKERDAPAEEKATPPTAPSSDRPVKKAVNPCPCTHWIKISLLSLADLQPRPNWWTAPRARPYAGEAFRAGITDGEKSTTVDFAGSVRYDGIPAGACEIQFVRFHKPRISSGRRIPGRKASDAEITNHTVVGSRQGSREPRD